MVEKSAISTVARLLFVGTLVEKKTILIQLSVDYVTINTESHSVRVTISRNNNTSIGKVKSWFSMDLTSQIYESIIYLL